MKDQALKPGELYRVTTGDWTHTATYEFIGKIDEQLAFRLPGGKTFTRYIDPEEILQLRRCTPEEISSQEKLLGQLH